MFARRFGLSDGQPTLHWDGKVLRGAAGARAVAVAVPARFVSFRREEFPPAAEPALKAAARMRAERAFAPLGPVAIEALLEPAHAGRRGALLMALPRTTLDAIRQAALAQGRTVVAVRVAELLAPVPDGGLVQVEGDACLLAVHGGRLAALAALGPVDAPGFPQVLARERLRLGVAEDSPGAPAAGAGVDFLHPVLDAPPPLLARPAVRLALLGSGVALAAILGVVLTVGDALAGRADARARAERARPLAKTLAARRADMKEVAGWFEERASMAPALHALAGALPAPGDDAQMRLVRVRQAAGEETVAEGMAGDRAQMMAFLGRLRQDPRVLAAEIRAFRSPSKGVSEVVFELGFRLDAAVAPHAPGALPRGAPDAPPDALDAPELPDDDDPLALPPPGPDAIAIPVAVPAGPEAPAVPAAPAVPSAAAPGPPAAALTAVPVPVSAEPAAPAVPAHLPPAGAPAIVPPPAAADALPAAPAQRGSDATP